MLFHCFCINIYLDVSKKKKTSQHKKKNEETLPEELPEDNLWELAEELPETNS